MLNKRWNKSGQATIFIIIAVLVIAFAVLFFALRGGLRKGEVLSPELAPVANFVEECLEESARSGVSSIALSGGYYDVPEPKKKFIPSDIPYYWYSGKSSIPSIEVVEIELSKYIDENLLDCTGDFDKFEDYSIQQGKVSSKSFFLSDKLKIELSYPLSVRKGNFTGQLNNFEKEIDTNFYEAYLLVEDILTEQEKSPNSVPLGAISSLAYENGFNFDTVTLDGDVLYFLVFNQDEENEFTYAFAGNYDWEDLE